MSKPFIAEYLERNCVELSPFEFYRALFPEGELESKEQEQQGATGKYNAIAQVLPEDKSKKIPPPIIIHNDLKAIKDLINQDEFTIVSPITYIGSRRKMKYAQNFYALAFDLDYIESEENIKALFNQIELELLPEPTYIVASGRGVHLYYQFEEPIPCFKTNTDELEKLKKELIEKIWNQYITTKYQDPEQNSIYQGFRMVGTATKDDKNIRARAFVYGCGKTTTFEKLCEYVGGEYKLVEFTRQSKYTLEECEVMFPEWYKNRIIKKLPPKHWLARINVYNNWLARIKKEANVGHRYWCVYFLAVYGVKCGVDRKKLEEDALSLVPLFDKLSTTEENRFTNQDVYSALQIYGKKYCAHFTADYISKMTGLKIIKRKRNYNKLDLHLELCRVKRDYMYPKGTWQNKNGAPTKQELVRDYRTAHPEASISKCARELGISRNTARKWWN